MANSTIPFSNTLNFSVTVYDSFSNKDKSNYFGTLTLLATVPANTKTSIQLLHPISALVVCNATNNTPLARLVYQPPLNKGPYSVGPADVKAMTETMAFITFISKNLNDPLTLKFNAIWKDTSQSPLRPVNQFFAQQKTYANCTFVTYMLGITYEAELPKTKGKPMDQALYSLSTLVKLLGGTWPSDLPDIVVTKFTCNTIDNVLNILADIDLKKLPAQSDQALQFFGSLFKVQQLEVTIYFNHSFSAGVLGTRLSIGLDAMHVPIGGSKTMIINQPLAMIDINPLFKFVVFTVTGSILFSIFGKKFEADVSMVIDNIEANFGVVIKGDNTSLPAPPVMKGVHFDAFGVGIGIIFEPLGAAIGLSGQLHIGDPASGFQATLDDDTFAVVCQVIEEVPNPLYVSFYVPQMHLTDVLTVFTNTRTTLNVPVSFTNLSFKWSENPMEPVALPDGSLSDMGYGFSAAAHILVFSLYGDIEIDPTNGLTADIEMAPLSLGGVFSMGGNGKGVSIKVDANGSPIKNDQIATTDAERQAIKAATMKQLVIPGGPVLKLQTFASPFLHLNGFVSLFEVENAQLNADITSSGIEFEVSFGALLITNMSCTLSDFHNLIAAFQFGINQAVSLPTIGGVSLGSFALQTSAGAHLTLNTGSSDLIISVGGSFNFNGMTRSFGDFTADAHIQRVSDILSAIANNIQQNAQHIFSDLLNTGSAWANKVQQGVITAADSVASVLHNAYNQDANQVAATMRDAGFSTDTITMELKQVFDPASVATALKNAFGWTATGVAQAMKTAGYAGDQVAGALNSAFGDAGQIGSAMKDVYGYSVDQVHDTLKSLGYAENQIGSAFQNLGGDFASAGNSILNALKPPSLPDPGSVLNDIGDVFKNPF